MVKMKTDFVGDRSEFSYTFPTQTNLSFFCHSFCHKTKTLFNTSEFRRKCVAIFVRRKCVGNFGRNNSSFLVVKSYYVYDKAKTTMGASTLSRNVVITFPWGRDETNVISLSHNK
ncbi:hypothetical protein Hanom_Chr15g01375871 [Helianthus anomalus]